MQRIILLKFSMSYWKNHLMRLFSILFILILGAGALCCGSLFIRSEKCAKLDYYYNMLGNYDIKVNSVSQDIYDRISGIDGIDKSGKYYEIGMASGKLSPARHMAISFPDEQSKELYGISCYKGSYPEKDNEIALDVSTANKLGIVPEPGQKVELTIVDDKGEPISENKEFTVTGIYQQSSDGSFGGWFRMPNNPEIIDDYNPPEIILSSAFLNSCDTSDMMVTCFFQRKNMDTAESDEDVKPVSGGIPEDGSQKISSEISLALGTEVDALKKIDYTESRTYVYSDILGMMYKFAHQYGSVNIENMTDAIKSGKSQKDFYSQILIPVLYLFIFIISLVSIINIVKNVVSDCSFNIGIMRGVGMKKGSSFWLIMTMFVLVIIPGIILGLLAGSGVYVLIINILNKYYGLNLELAFNCPELVKLVTYDPYIFPAAAVLVSAVIAVILPALKMTGMTPLYLMSDDHKNRRSFSRKKQVDGRKAISRSTIWATRSWRRLLGRRLALSDVSSLIIIILIASTAVFGYSYFRIYSNMHMMDDSNETYKEFSEKDDYIAEKSSNIGVLPYSVENHHEYGVSLSKADEISKDSNVKETFGYILNKSTRLSYKEVSESKKDLLDEFQLNAQRPDPDSYPGKDSDEYKLDMAAYESGRALEEGTGYDPSDNVYSVPTKGMSDNEIEGLKKYIKAGTIDADKIRSGEEVIIAVPGKLGDKVLSAFSPGETLPLSDIILSQEEEDYDPVSFEGYDYGLTPVYLKNVKVEDGHKIPVHSFAVGKRKDLITRVGAIAVIDNKADVKKYLSKTSDYYAPTFGMTIPDYSRLKPVNIICGYSTFQNWGLPDKNLTYFSVKLKDKGKNIDKLWYSRMADCKGMVFTSTSQKMSLINNERRKIMVIFYIMILLVIVSGMLSVSLSLYTRGRLHGKEFSYMRAQGMKISQIVGLMIYENLYYPIMGVLISLLPVALMQKLLVTIRTNLQSGRWNPDNDLNAGRGLPWYMDLPYKQDILNEHTLLIMASVLVLLMVLLILAMIPQISYLKKRSIIDELDDTSF
jgi:ABC-type antimicrobial peptide transport system permease subunit